ncbi:MAG: hypothetical protein NC177_05940 [Ruminococcus flavefaciens]|nr:hypothetical protein [Ruminococcus flavefaciens]
MSSKTISMIKSTSTADKKLMSIVAQFYMKLPEEVIDHAIENLSRDAKRKVKKEKQTDKKILMALNLSANKFADEIYQYQRGSILFSPDAEYEDILNSYNGENCIMNTVLILKKCCDGSFEMKTMADFLKSEQFTKTLTDNYNNYEETTETEDIPEEELPEEIDEISEVPEDETETEPETEYILETDIKSDEIFTVPEFTEEISGVAEEISLKVPEKVPEKIQEKTESAPVPEKKKSKETYYIGHIEKRETYYNFAPQYKLEKTSSRRNLIELRQVAETFPPNGTINLSYVRSGVSQSQKIIEKLDLQNTFAIAFDESILEENINYLTGEKHGDVNLKIDLQKEFDNNRNATTFFKKIGDLKIHRIAETSEFIPDSRLFKDYIEVSNDFAQGEWILLRRFNDGDDVSAYVDISGPYRVDKNNGKTYIQPKAEKSGYMINCYNQDKLAFGMSERQEFGCDPVCIPFAVVEDEFKYKKDIISDELLIKCILAEASKDFLNIIKKKPEEMAEILSRSAFISKNIPDEIKAERLARVRKLFADIQNYTAEQKKIAETFLHGYSTDSEIKEILSEIITSSPEFKSLQKEVEKKSKAVKTAKAEPKVITVDTAKTKKIIDSNAEIQELEKKIAELKEQYSALSSYGDIIKDIEYQKGIRAFLSEENSRLQHKNSEIKGKIKSTITEQANEVGIAFDPYVSNAMLEAASQWNRKQETEIYKSAVSYIVEKTKTCRHMEKTELRDYLIDYVKQYRNYSTNDIINMYVCITQGFLTVFSGLPGTGKTSVCNIIGNSLGLTDFGNGEINYNRFVPVAVEKGWSSKKDLIGYYNPLTQKYDKSNRRLYDSLMVLNEEKDDSPFPYLVLLDEANLSPMEYYWADFMQIADKYDNSEAYINIGLENDIYIPDTLRFVATINNDQTTETLSPRLLDRVWIIKLPDSDIKEEIPCPAEKIFWKDLSETFGTVSSESKISCESLLEQIFRLFQNFGMAVSPRIQLSMRRYILSAREVMESVNGITPEYIAVDYAVMQRLLPKINGHIKMYREFFDKLIFICNTNHLDMTKNALEEMKNNSSRNMGYCQYLS